MIIIKCHRKKTGKMKHKGDDLMVGGLDKTVESDEIYNCAEGLSRESSSLLLRTEPGSRRLGMS